MATLLSPSNPPAAASEADNIPDLSTLPAFEMSFSIPLECAACVESVQKAVSNVPGIQFATPSLETQTLHTLGTAAPSAILAAIQATGRDAVVRGTGSGTGSAAAVAILEDYDTDDYSSSPVRGLARIVQVRTASSGSTSGSPSASTAAPTTASSTTPALNVVDISLSGLSPGVYAASIRATGDISRGSQSVGAVWRGVGGRMDVGSDGLGSAVVVSSGWAVWEAVGRAFAVERVDDDGEIADGEGGKGARMMLGVIARSAGVWDNDKMVCSCSGKTVWEERVEQKGRGML